MAVGPQHVIAADALGFADEPYDALLDDYYAKFYGPVRDEMKAFVEYCESHWSTMRDSLQEMDQTLALLSAARSAAGAGVYSQRVELLTEYVKPLIPIRNRMADKFVAQNGQTPEAPYLTWATAARLTRVK